MLEKLLSAGPTQGREKAFPTVPKQKPSGDQKRQPLFEWHRFPRLSALSVLLHMMLSHNVCSNKGHYVVEALPHKTTKVQGCTNES